MATNKHAMIRYQALDACFANRYKRFYIEDLIEACNKALKEFYISKEDPINDVEYYVKKRTIFNDIAFMQSAEGWDAPIKRYYVGGGVTTVMRMSAFLSTRKTSLRPN